MYNSCKRQNCTYVYFCNIQEDIWIFIYFMIYYYLENAAPSVRLELTNLKLRFYALTT